MKMLPIMHMSVIKVWAGILGVLFPKTRRAPARNWCLVSIWWMSIHYDWMHNEIKHLELIYMYNFAFPLLNNQGYCWRKLVTAWGAMGAEEIVPFLNPCPGWFFWSSLRKASFSFIAVFLVLTKHSDITISKWLCKLNDLSSCLFINT